jgi:hypothetical protein
VACQSGHDRIINTPILIREDDFLITDPYSVYELDSQLIFDLPNQGKFVLLDGKSGRKVIERSYSELFNPITSTNLTSLVAALQKADPQFVSLTRINPGWFTSQRGDIIFIGYVLYSRQPETEFAEVEGTANVLLVLDHELNPKSGNLLFPASVQISSPPPTIAYYPNAYLSGDVINDSLYIPNYYLEGNQLTQKLPAFSVWDITQLSNVKLISPRGETGNFLTANQLVDSENGFVFFASVVSFNQHKKTHLLAISEDGVGEDLSNGMPIVINSNSILIQVVRQKGRPNQLLFLDYHPKEKSFRRYFTATNLQKEDSLAIVPPEGFIIKKIVEQKNNHFTGAKFILSKNDSLFLWSYSY